VKRVSPDYPLNREDWEAITLKPGDAVIGAAAAADADTLVFVTGQAQLLRYEASAVRPQGRTAGGMAGIKLADGDEAIFFGVVGAEDAGAGAEPGEGVEVPRGVVVTIAGADGALPGTTAGTAKVTPLDEYPAKGRATGGVRSHRFLKGEDRLTLAWVGRGPARASSSSGVARSLPSEFGRRDGSGIPLAQAVDEIGPTFA
jgi:DNA gyrase subunit A